MRAKMGMTIYESIRELEKARDSIEPYIFMDEAIDQSMKTAIKIMHKYQKITEIVKAWNDMNSFDSMVQISEVLEDDSSDMDNSDM